MSEWSAHDVSGAPAAGPSRSVLYIEDDAANVQLVGLILQGIPNLRFSSASSGAEGLRVARGSQPGLILLDLGLPDMSGEDLLAQLRADAPTRDVPVVIVSGDLPVERQEQLASHDVAAFLVKPYGIGDLLSLVESALTPAP
jgi:CheY-like chemotaxis protein